MDEFLHAVNVLISHYRAHRDAQPAASKDERIAGAIETINRLRAGNVIDNTTQFKLLQRLNTSYREFSQVKQCFPVLWLMLVQALTAFDCQPKETELMELCDSDGDGLISFNEYVFYTTLLQRTCASDCRVAFLMVCCSPYENDSYTIRKLR